MKVACGVDEGGEAGGVYRARSRTGAEGIARRAVATWPLEVARCHGIALPCSAGGVRIGHRSGSDAAKLGLLFCAGVGSFTLRARVAGRDRTRHERSSESRTHHAGVLYTRTWPRPAAASCQVGFLKSDLGRLLPGDPDRHVVGDLRERRRDRDELALEAGSGRRHVHRDPRFSPFTPVVLSIESLSEDALMLSTPPPTPRTGLPSNAEMVHGPLIAASL